MTVSRTSLARNRTRGFTLTEIAVAVAILALLLGGLLMPLSAQFEAAKVREAQRQLEVARDAIIGFAVANGRLPCPARPDRAIGTPVVGLPTDPPAGVAWFDPAPPAPARYGECYADSRMIVAAGTPQEASFASGVLPWVSLGLPETDPWGRRLTYVVDHSFADISSAKRPLPGVPCSPLEPVAPAPPSVVPPTSFCATASEPFALIDVRTRDRTGDGPPAETVQAEQIVAYVIIHGRNGNFAWTPAGTAQIGGSGGLASDEARNRVWFDSAASPTRWTSYVSANKVIAYDRPLVRRTGACNDHATDSALCEFDDQIIYISRSLLVGRMAAAGRL